MCLNAYVKHFDIPKTPEDLLAIAKLNFNRIFKLSLQSRGHMLAVNG